MIMRNSKNMQTYTIEIHKLVIMILSYMSIFFGFGVWSSLDSPIKNNVLIMLRNWHNSSTSSSGDLHEHHVHFHKPSYEDLGSGKGAISRNTSSIHIDSYKENATTGQHLLMDIQNVQTSFLNSEERLAAAMVDTVNSAELVMLSYHCHLLVPSGVSCVGIMPGGHISFHTWPEQGVITLDLSSCGKKSLLSVLPEVERLFGVPHNESGQVQSNWSHELRGFSHYNDDKMSYDFNKPASKTNYLDSKSDLSTWVMTPNTMKYKAEVLAMASQYNRIDIWDVKYETQKVLYEDGLKHNLMQDDPRWLSHELSRPHRLLFVNGALQSIDTFVQEYQESLVHPTMISHPYPVNVAIIGGVDGSTIREVLKHRSVQFVNMIEQDKVLVDVTREHLSSLSNCSDIVGIHDNCFDDERVHITDEDPTKWFIERFGTNCAATYTQEQVDHRVDTFDVIIFNTLEPKDKQQLFNNKEFLDAIMNSLGDDGMLVTTLGESPTIHNPRAEYSEKAASERLIQLLESNEQTGAMFVYEEDHTGMEVPITFLAVCKNVRCRDSWYADAVVIDYNLSIRLRETKSKQSILMHYDGPMHNLFQIPPRAWENTYCRRDPEPNECKFRSLDLSKDIFDMNVENEDDSSFNILVRYDNDTGKEIMAIYAKEDIPAGSYIMPTDLAGSFSITDYTHSSLKSIVQTQGIGDASVIKKFLQFIDHHGHETVSDGHSLRYVETGATFMIRKSSNMDEVNIGCWIPEHLRSKNQPVYSPVFDRHLASFDLFLVATKDIKKGDELVKPTNLW